MARRLYVLSVDMIVEVKAYLSSLRVWFMIPHSFRFRSLAGVGINHALGMSDGRQRPSVCGVRGKGPLWNAMRPLSPLLSSPNLTVAFLLLALFVYCSVCFRRLNCYETYLIAFCLLLLLV